MVHLAKEQDNFKEFILIIIKENASQMFAFQDAITSNLLILFIHV